MAKKIRVFHKVPGGPYVSTVRFANTRFLQNQGTGRLEGRKKTKKGSKKVDKIVRKRAKKDFILVKKSKNSRGHIRQVRKEVLDGQFI